MRARFSDASVPSRVFSGIAKIVKEAAIRARSDALVLRAMDPSHVAMVELVFPRDSFDEYEADDEVFVVNLEDLAKVLKRGSEKEKLELRTLQKEKAFEVVLEGRFARVFRQALLESEVEEVGELKIPFKVDARALAEHFEEAVKVVEPFGDILGLAATEGKLEVFNEGELGRASVELTVEGGALISISVEDGEQRAAYSIDYVLNVLAAAHKAETVRVQFATDMPCKITFELPQGAWLALYVAPRTA